VLRPRELTEPHSSPYKEPGGRRTNYWKLPETMQPSVTTTTD
jgi:hypothetical protein